MEPQSGIKTWQWVVTVIVIIVLIIIGIMVFGNKKTDETGLTDQNTPVVDTTTPAEVNRIVMSDQFPGNVVYLSSVTLANGGWVEIHADKNGQPGEYVGSAYFEKGINPGKITLTKPTVEGGISYAMLHSDDGDKKFDATKDLPIKDSKGNIVMKLFRASAAVGAGVKG
jgi:hypothetical protein